MSQALSRLKEDLDEALHIKNKRERHEENVQRLARELKALENTAGAPLAEFSDLLALGGATDPESFRMRGRWFAARQSCLEQVRQQEKAIDLIAGLGRGPQLQSDLAQTDPTSIKTDLADRKNALVDLNERRREKQEAKGRLAKSIEDMEQSDQLSTAMTEESTLRAQLEQAASDWAVRAICREILRQTRERYELEKQPRVIQQASDFFHNITLGAYQVLSPYGQEEAQVVAPGVRKEATKLSRGTREQLYLSLRFGLIREYSSAAEPLPVVMDDILVNCDPKRCRAAAETILQLAQSNQVLFFTCHPETAGLFSSMDNTIAQFAVQNETIARV
jgi:uncharacterized protein YhaN